MRRFLGLVPLLGLFLTLGIFDTALAAEFYELKSGAQSRHLVAGQLYASEKIVVQFDEATASAVYGRHDPRIRGPRLGSRIGFSAFDAVSARFAVAEVEQLFVGSRQSRTRAPAASDLSGYFVVYFDPSNDLDAVLNAYAAVPGVHHVEPVGIHKMDLIPNDVFFPQQWHLNQANDADVDAPEAWDISTGDANVLVGILDTGVNYQHEDLGGAAPFTNGNIWINQPEQNGLPGVDDDGNGFIDDNVGWDFVTGKTVWPGEDGQTPDNDPNDFNGHGTHVAGIVGAMCNNATIGVCGIAGGNGSPGNGVKLVSLRIGWSQNFLGQEAGFVDMAFAAAAINYAVNKGVTAINCSWGTSNTGGIGAAVNNAIANGVIVVHAAGNDNSSAQDFFGSIPDIVNVASSDQGDVRSTFSNFGTWVDITAPGTSIASTYSDHYTPTYVFLSGTSMASPLVAGVMALTRSANPALTSTQIIDRVLSTADNIDAQNPTFVGLLGSGRVNAFNAVNFGPPVLPVADFNGAPTTGNAPLTVNFTDLSTGAPSAWSWDFGDGGTSTVQNPSHTYSTAGTFTVSLTATNGAGSDTATKLNFITVNQGPPAGQGFILSKNADFSTDDRTFATAETIHMMIFSDVIDVNDIKKNEWNLESGTGATAGSFNNNLDGTFTSSIAVSALPGGATSWNWSARLEDGNGNRFQPTAALTISAGPPPPVADFNAAPTAGCVPVAVTFTDASTGGPTSWSWDFGDGGTSTLQNPSHTYTVPGSYTVSLTVTGPTGSDTNTQADLINAQTVPVADFAGTPLTGGAPLTVDFSDQSTGGPTTWAWTFGDGGTSTQQNPSHTYTVPGVYTVALTSSNVCGSGAVTKVGFITVTDPPAGPNVHVSALVVSRQDQGGGRFIGVAQVTIVDQDNNPVKDVTVTGTFTGPATETQSATTDNAGLAVVESNRVTNPVGEWCFEVTDAAPKGGTPPYDPGSNVTTQACESGPVFATTSARPQIELNEHTVAYPNPFNPVTRIVFELLRSGNVTIDVYDVRGRRVRRVTDRSYEAGVHTEVFDAAGLASGIYFYRVQAPGYTATRKLVLTK